MTEHDPDFPYPLVEMRVRRLVLNRPRAISGAEPPHARGAAPQEPDGGQPTRGHDLGQGPKPQPG